MLEKDRWQTRAGKLVCLAIVLGGIYIILKYGLGLLLPFLFAWALAIPISALSGRCARRLGGKKKAWAVFYLAVFFGGIALAVALVVGKLLSETAELLDYVAENGEAIAESLRTAVKGFLEIPSKIPFFEKLSEIDLLDGLGEYISEAAASLGQQIAGKGGAVLITSLAGLVLKTPRVLVSVAVAVLSSIYLTIEYEDIKEYIFGLFSPAGRKRAHRLADRIGEGLRSYLGAYGKMFLITFSELYAGFFILGRKYSFLIALIVAALDLLPFFGAGIVLVPWGIVLLVSENYAAGAGMLVLFFVMTVVRQIVEPRLIGKSIGIHPLASLISMYVGLRTFGFWGMVIAPIGVLVAKEILESGRENIQEKT